MCGSYNTTHQEDDFEAPFLYPYLVLFPLAGPSGRRNIRWFSKKIRFCIAGENRAYCVGSSITKYDKISKIELLEISCGRKLNLYSLIGKTAHGITLSG